MPGPGFPTAWRGANWKVQGGGLCGAILYSVLNVRERRWQKACTFFTTVFLEHFSAFHLLEREELSSAELELGCFYEKHALTHDYDYNTDEANQARGPPLVRRRRFNRPPPSWTTHRCPPRAAAAPR
eukprot:scaffold136829_cov133-Phaeocystis_antarctica.AAC.1